MNTEKKINAIMRYIVAENMEEKNEALYEIKKIMQGGETKEKNANVDEIIETILTEMGMPCSLLGYNYTVCAIKLVIENTDIINSIVYGIYPNVAKKYGTTGVRVERAIRHTIERTWDNADIDIIEKYFGNTISPNKGKPTNGEFIARVANIVRRRTQNG